GADKAPYMLEMFSEADLEAMWQLRCAFDSENRFNPGKVFPTPRLCGDRPGKYVPTRAELSGEAGRGWCLPEPGRELTRTRGWARSRAGFTLQAPWRRPATSWARPRARDCPSASSAAARSWSLGLRSTSSTPCCKPRG